MERIEERRESVVMSKLAPGGKHRIALAWWDHVSSRWRCLGCLSFWHPAHKCEHSVGH